MAENDSKNKSDWGTGIEVRERPSQKTKRPAMYIVFVHNDPFTPRDFVVLVLMMFFNKTKDQALAVMMAAHTKGMGAAGIYTKEIAESKAATVNEYCQGQGKILFFSVQEEPAKE